MEEYSDYQELNLKLTQLIEQQDYQQAVDVIEKNRKNFTEHEFDITCLLMEFYERLGNIKKRMATIRRGHEQGYFYFLHPDLSKYHEIADNRGFDSLYEADKKLRMEANRKNRVEYEVVLPEDFTSDKIYPMIMVFHDQGSNLEKCKQNWNFPPSVKDRFILVFFQSYLHCDYLTYTWTSYDPRIREEVRQNFKKIKSEYPVNHDEVYLTGVGAGANAVIDLAVNNIIQVSGFIAWFPTQNGYYDPQLVNQAASRGVRGLIVFNQKDVEGGKFKKMVKTLQDSKFNYEIILKKESKTDFKNVFENEFPDFMVNLNIETT